MENRKGACGDLRFELVPAPGGLADTYTVWLASNEAIRATVSAYGAAHALQLAARKVAGLVPAYEACPTERRRAVSQFWGEIQTWDEPGITWFD